MPRPLPITACSRSPSPSVYSRYPRNVKCSSASQRSSSRASVTSLSGTGSSAWASSSAIARALPRIFSQSSTASRTSVSTRCRSLRMRSSTSGSAWRSISMCIHDSTTSFSPGGTSGSSAYRTSSSLPSTARRTTSCGWTSRWMPMSCRASSAVTESTRNGMSSVTISITLCPPHQPLSLCSGVITRRLSWPGTRWAASSRCDRGATTRSWAVRSWSSSAGTYHQYTGSSAANSASSVSFAASAMRSSLSRSAGSSAGSSGVATACSDEGWSPSVARACGFIGSLSPRSPRRCGAYPPP